MKKKKFSLCDAGFLAGVPLIFFLIWIGLSIWNFYVGSTRYYFSTYGLKYYARKILTDDLSEVLGFNENTKVQSPDKWQNNLLIDVDLNEFDRLSDNLPLSGEERIDVLMNNQPAKLSLRGSRQVHWLGNPKSLFLRFPKNQLFLGHRKWILSIKAIMSQHAAFLLADYMGIMTALSRPVHVFMNRRYYSPMHLLELIDEQFLLDRRRMPGVLIDGANYYMSKRDIPGVERSLFINPYSWEYDGNERLIVEARTIMQEVACLLLQGGEAVQSEIESCFALDEMAQVMALQLLCNNFHMDGWHNQRFYYDPLDGKMHPIWWDTGIAPWDCPINAGIVRITSASVMNRLMIRLLRNQFFYQKVLNTVQSAFQGGGFEQVLQTIADREAAFDDVMKLSRDESKSQGSGSISEIVEQNAQLLRRILNYTCLTYASTSQNATNNLLIQTLSWGSVVFQGFSVNQQLVEPYIWADLNFNGVIDSGDRRVALIGESLEQGAWLYRLEDFDLLYSGCRFSGYPRDVSAGIEPETLCYSYLFRGTGDIMSIQAKSATPSADETVMIQKVPFDAIVPVTSTIHPWSFKKETGRQIEYSGDVVLTNTIVIEAEDTCVIQSGTHLRLASSVSLICYGRLYAEGTQDAPITIDALDVEAPFGVIALQGEGANKSSLRYVQFVHGSRATVRHVPYSGMLSIHYANQVRVEHCSFGRNYIGDDALRAAKSDVVVSNCVFSHVRSDAIDFDFSTGIITDCRFRDTGNDAIDLMGSDITITDNDIRVCGDKGVSVGNASYPVITGNIIAACAIGVESKDRSCPTVMFNTFIENDMAIHAYKKNWRYGTGGFGLVFGNKLTGNELNWSADAHSMLYGIICNLYDE